MGSFSIWHWTILLLLVTVPALLIGGLVWLIVRVSRRRRGTPSQLPSTATGTASERTDDRLNRLHALFEQGQITREEYERQRASIISSV
ncbi:SHOCT domain-containing protein [Luteimonas kalidii]|uniref:SHOCT domain-containing protein n=1 Tax=Luteimonas kalidii TaxID=3042025 RepID=A0ABT6JRR1_9GAMM|nr:SHOCT domain-containing protein [Luteimonas kalidii]MDH5833282.1 SHOCT domain-containing protein [Luteimonas kalidii]